MTDRDSLDAAYFEGIFRDDPDPWQLASSDYEAAKFDRTIAAIDDRRYATAIEIGCAHGVLTQRLARLCDDLLAIDISAAAIARARERVAGVRFAQCAFPNDAPPATGLDLIVLSEVVYYWSDADLRRAGAWIPDALAPGGRVLLVHWTGKTDYPQTGDAAVTKLHETLNTVVTVERADRTADYRLDLWRR